VEIREIELKLLFAILLALSLSAFAEPRPRPVTWAQPMLHSELGNFYFVDEGVYRSSQPDDDEAEEIVGLGIKEVLNLRELHSDKDELGGNGLILHRVKMDAGNITDQQLITALKFIKNRSGAILVHCWHGSDRTGATIAAYRIVFENWTKAEAIDEMRNGGYGYHETVYPNIVDLINQIDVEEYRKKLGLHGLKYNQ